MAQKEYTTIYIVRHGETEWNVKGITMGQSDAPLTAKGLAQADSLREQFKDIHFDTVFSSDLLRAKRTAEIISLDRKLMINTTKLLRERAYGKREGKHYTLFEQKNREMLEKLSEAERWRAKLDDDIESNEEICNRLILFLREVGATYIGKTILVVSHGGLMRTFLVHLGWAKMEELPPGSMGNTGYIKLASNGIDFTIQAVEGVKKKDPHAE